MNTSVSQMTEKPQGPEGEKYRRRASDLIKPVINTILSSGSISRTMDSLTEEMKELFDCAALSIYSVDRNNRQIFSRNIKTAENGELRFELSPKNLPGFIAATGKTLNIANVYSKEELSQVHADLALGYDWGQIINIKTRSALLVALPYEKRLIGVLELRNKISEEKFSDWDVRLAKELAHPLGHALVKIEIEEIEEKIQATSLAIHSAESVDEILLELKKPILQLFEADLITIYAVDNKNSEIYSKMKSGDAINEIRVPISTKSISGCVAKLKRPVNLANVYDQSELSNYHKDLTFDSSWDKKSGLRTRSMLVQPLTQGAQLMGVLQLINKKNDGVFTSFDEKNAKIIADTLALAFFNQRKSSIKKNTKFSYLIDHGLITQDELNTAIQKARTSQVELEDILLQDLKLKRKDIGKSLETYYEIPYTGYVDSTVLPQHVLSGLNKNYLVKNLWVPLQNDPQSAVILVADPSDQDKIRNIRMIFRKKKLEFRVGLVADIRGYLNSSVSMDEEPVEDVKSEAMSSLLTALEDEKGEVTTEITSSANDEINAISETDSTIVRLVNKILTDAYDQGVSDIHIEPGIGKKDIRVRFRKDGSCVVYQYIPFLYKQAIISRIKIMSKLDIAERRSPQDGKIKMKYGRNEIEYRVATCPTVGGNEDAVLRILAASKPIPLTKMNFQERNLELIKSKVVTPYGLILVVGPTGSGKTTTLHSCLGHINTPERKIWTAEDPVEITQEGLRQVQMQNKIGLNFSTAMRSFLRGDPDVIMVGEMRDEETAAIGLEASLTGHLVFSTLHTNSAPETITRLLNMGMNPLNFADAVLLIVAQRLVKTLCGNCKEDYHPDKSEFETLAREYGEEGFAKLGVKYTSDLTLKKPVGCPQCGDSGYAGRTALHELLEGTQDIKRLITKRVPVEDIRIQAVKDGMTTLKQDGIYKVLKGDCNLKQILTVCIM